MLFNEDETKKITMSSVAKEVGLAKSSIYEYFSSKDDMVVSAIKSSMDKFSIFDHPDEDLLLDFKEAYELRFRRVLKRMKVIPFNENKVMAIMDTVLTTKSKMKLKEYMGKKQEENFKSFTSFCEHGSKTGVLK